MKALPQEIEVWYVVPALRRELAKAMLAKGMKQKDIAEHLGITKSAVNQYLKQKRAKEVEFSKETLEEIKKSAEIIIKNPALALAELQRLCLIVKKKMKLCEIHRKLENVPEECRICFGETDENLSG